MNIYLEMWIEVPDDHPVMNSPIPQRKVMDQMTEYARDQDYKVASVRSEVKD